MPDAPEAKVRARAGAIGFSRRMADTPAGQLSGGEKARLLLGLATFSGPHLVMLDEPTNHLDIDSRSALIAAINDFPGAVILVSHDRYLIEACADRLLLVADGRVAAVRRRPRRLPRLVLAERGRRGREGAADTEGRRPNAAGRADARRAAAERRIELAPLRRRIADGGGGRRTPASGDRANRFGAGRARAVRPRSRQGRGARQGARRSCARSPRPRRTGSRRARSRSEWCK